MPPIHNHVVNHIAISVPDCDAAVEWYGAVFGFKRIRSNRMTERKLMPSAPIYKIYGSALRTVKIAFLGTGNGVGLEVFEFIDPPYKPPLAEFEFNRGGFFHIAVTAPDVDEACRRAVERGGKQVGETVDLVNGERALYVKDPWGNVVEVLSCSFESLMANSG